ncbi:MAG: class I SAM-dependent methyltransferase, partial [Planctomycetes bacterium]|nr:class I SAM-dependent methyltransferase [Planctomycetota bacterium]
MTAHMPTPDGPWHLRDVPCDFCGSADADILCRGFDRLHGLPGEFHLVACRQCGLARTNPQPTPESLPTAYPSSYEPHQGLRQPARPPARLLRWALVNQRGYPLGRPSAAPLRWLMWPWATLALRRRRAMGYIAYEGNGRLLDFGCGAGGYIARMVAAGWRAEGLDASPHAVRAGTEAGLVVHQGTLPGAGLPAGAFDVVTLWASLEHVPSPMAVLKAVRALLSPGGRIVAAVPQFGGRSARWFGSAWFGLDLPRHLTHFSQLTLRRHMEAAGLVVEGVQCVRRPSFIRRSFAQLADEKGRSIHRRLARSRFLAGLLGYATVPGGATDEILV